MDLTLRGIFTRVATVVAIIAIFEVLSVLMITEDADGNKFFREKRLLPYKLPIRTVQRAVSDYIATMKSEPSTIRYMYDERFGWVGNPSYRDGTEYNGQFIRTKKDHFGSHPADDTLRLMVFGDSFSQSTPLDLSDSWGEQLASHFTRGGRSAETLNLAVGGYGLDQAFIRWQEDGRQYHPDIVLLGLYPHEIFRTVAIFRYDSNLFSKPRLGIDGESLFRINYPTLSLDELVQHVPGVFESDLGKQDLLLLDRRRYYRYHFWNISNTACIIQTNILFNRMQMAHKYDDYYQVDSPSGELALRIIKEFHESVANSGAQFWVVHIPGQVQTKRLLMNQPLGYSELLSEIMSSVDVIDCSGVLLQSRKSGIDIYFGDGHHNTTGDAIIAEYIHEVLSSRIDQRSH